MSARAHAGLSSRPLTPVALCLLLLAALAAGPAGAQIFKCTDSVGNVLYLNGKCPKGTTADRVDIFDNTWTADRDEKDAAWQRAAAAHQVVAGMPLQWVRDALGEPAEVTRTPTAGASEVWHYNLPERIVQVGILANQVLWVRETPVVAAAVEAPTPANPAAGAAPEVLHASPQLAPAAQATGALPDVAAPSFGAAPEVLHASPQFPPATQAAAALPDVARPSLPSAKIGASTHGVTRGQDCRAALAQLGTPDRQRELPALDKASDPVTEYFYEPAGGDNPTRTRVVCSNGRVEGIERTVVR